MTAPARLVSIRSGRYADAALLAAAVVGLAVTVVHWAGLVVGGVLVGLVSSSLPRALVNGVTFGAVVLGAFAVWLASQGALLTWTGTGQIFLLSVATGVGLPALAAVAVRGMV